MLLNKIVIGSMLVSTTAAAQVVKVQPVEVLYGNKVYRGQHQVVLSSPDDVTVIPAEIPKNNVLANMVVSSNPNKLSYLEESKIAKREKEIYDEVNRRTEEAPFTVLFTGHIPESIQQRRLNMMPEVGIFGDQLEKLQQDQASLHANDDTGVNEGEFSEVQPGSRVLGTPPPEEADSASAPEADAQQEEQAELTNEQKLEQLIGG